MCGENNSVVLVDLVIAIGIAWNCRQEIAGLVDVENRFVGEIIVGHHENLIVQRIVGHGGIDSAAYAICSRSSIRTKNSQTFIAPGEKKSTRIEEHARGALVFVIVGVESNALRPRQWHPGVERFVYVLNVESFYQTTGCTIADAGIKTSIVVDGDRAAGTGDGTEYDLIGRL